jgi:hypothetical protein
VCTSIVVASELRYGAARRGSARLTRQVELVLSAIKVLPLEEPADARYGKLRATLEQAGTPIGPNDLLIAAGSPERAGRGDPPAWPEGGQSGSNSRLARTGASSSSGACVDGCVNDRRWAWRR